MPELPEVETIRRQLEPELTGRVIASAIILDQRFTRPVPPMGVAMRLEGRRIEAVGRRGKYLVVALDHGLALVMHLRMTGNLVLRPALGDGAGDEVGTDGAERLGPRRLYEGEPMARHLRARFELDDGSALLFIDPRRFGHAVVLERPDALERYFTERLGVEPLGGELTPELLGGLVAGRTAPLKSFLLTQSRVAGIGNIYADEALHRARLHPLSPAGSLKPAHCEDLVEGIIGALEAGLALGGASIDDYRDARGQSGSMQDEFLVHTREGLPCPRCGEQIKRIVVSGRSTYFCPVCQVRLRRRPRRRRPLARLG